MSTSLLTMLAGTSPRAMVRMLLQASIVLSRAISSVHARPWFLVTWTVPLLIPTHITPGATFEVVMALIVAPWPTLLIVSGLYLAMIPVALASYARVKRRRATAR